MDERCVSLADLKKPNNRKHRASTPAATVPKVNPRAQRFDHEAEFISILERIHMLLAVRTAYTASTCWPILITPYHFILVQVEVCRSASTGCHKKGYTEQLDLATDPAAMAITAAHVPAGAAVAPVMKKRKRAELTGKITAGLPDEAFDESDACGSDHGAAAARTEHPAAAVPSSTAHAPSPAQQLLLQEVLAQPVSQHRDQATAATDGVTEDCHKVRVFQETAPDVNHDVFKKVGGLCMIQE